MATRPAARSPPRRGRGRGLWSPARLRAGRLGRRAPQTARRRGRPRATPAGRVPGLRGSEREGRRGSPPGLRGAGAVSGRRLRGRRPGRRDPRREEGNALPAPAGRKRWPPRPARGLTPGIRRFGRPGRAGREVGRSRPAWPTWGSPVSTENTHVRRAWRRGPAAPATRGAEAGDSLGPGRRRSRRAEMAPLRCSPAWLRSETPSPNGEVALCGATGKEPPARPGSRGRGRTGRSGGRPDEGAKGREAHEDSARLRNGRRSGNLRREKTPGGERQRTRSRGAAGVGRAKTAPGPGGSGCSVTTTEI
nr:translation initiation factor IF-2-like [Saimiri boliviensis boliviensis]